ncbi:MAG: hypothetical protein A3E21_00575 [Sulfurimonas sp. RIFCSPHIGHO2_12_FULL_36_9]|uniref:hypothetical protein n=1 Tax=Sulfurimonas sp. RIFCSPLOWO2_12_36_12 TaxID=1802253 RepID=UPI0008B262F6|nr:hypothetical protein [Sulfurimonas sp. RIFCSPLOWO2_12_36_12]OHD97302.1 MAG: hypothetical protein A3J26_03255 [Sulfurimonas sp. RIFCSPLOWO2_02_FULL_36_28]OHD99279.1 MAG: hypothetical protein A3E21_00575 [Sulfurimonas sp. RIFCSPHIGHO2_12_FULL_36_9]OHE01243.1 MAG: hypothetical protein A3K14_08480 [Sulfurimonas sp. RIFCSPLOWO2_12_FULL_36_74]OHE01492.1 MAG: hypothetical protein A2W82_02580 [Sulfurimonas sp. RIFCSPLOWO2_12_36_12]
MKNFNILRTFLALFTLFFMSACNSSDAVTNSEQRCPKCNMSTHESNINTAKLHNKAKTYVFDDIGCLVLWAKDTDTDLNGSDVEVFSNDTQKYIPASNAFFTTDEQTPMNYGFSAYEKKRSSSIKIDEVSIKMLRGEHMANPKIRKQMLAN